MNVQEVRQQFEEYKQIATQTDLQVPAELISNVEKALNMLEGFPEKFDPLRTIDHLFTVYQEFKTAVITQIEERKKALTELEIAVHRLNIRMIQVRQRSTDKLRKESFNDS